MDRKRIEIVPHDYPGITVLVPEQRAVKIKVIELGPIIPGTIPEADSSGFKVIRYIVNIVLYNEQDEPIKTFDPPIEIRVGYNITDVMQSDCDIHRLKLAYWDGDKYVIISDREHDYHILPPSTGQVAEAKIWSWVGDPPLVWGR